MRFKLLLPVFAIAFAAAPAFSDTFTFNIDNCTGTCGAAPFGTVTVTQDVNPNTVDIGVSLTSGNNFWSSGFPGSFGFNITDPDPTISVNNLSSGWSLNSTSGGSLHFDGFGNLDYALSCSDCGPHDDPVTSLSFSVTADGLTPASFQELSSIPPGSDRAYFVADIMGANGNTGVVGATLTSTTAVPEPSSFLLSAAGALALLMFLFGRRRKSA
ncbi:MAG TPA: PEP-CTERM sorting domain-containing protein [Bryobacteraceae bacterium]